MSTPQPPLPPEAPPQIPVGSITCPRCQSVVIPGQDWCLVCGAPARTRLAPAPNWRLPVWIVSALLAVALIVLIVAFASLTGGSDPVTGTTSTTGATVPTATTTPAGVPPVSTSTSIDPSTPPVTGTVGTDVTPGTTTPPAATTTADPPASTSTTPVQP